MEDCGFGSRYLPITFTRMFEPRHNILSNVRTNVRRYVVTWLEHSRECNRPVHGPLLAELSINFVFSLQMIIMMPAPTKRVRIKSRSRKHDGIRRPLLFPGLINEQTKLSITSSLEQSIDDFYSNRVLPESLLLQENYDEYKRGLKLFRRLLLRTRTPLDLRDPILPDKDGPDVTSQRDITIILPIKPADLKVVEETLGYVKLRMKKPSDENDTDVETTEMYRSQLSTDGHHVNCKKVCQKLFKAMDYALNKNDSKRGKRKRKRVRILSEIEEESQKNDAKINDSDLTPILKQTDDTMTSRDSEIMTSAKSNDDVTSANNNDVIKGDDVTISDTNIHASSIPMTVETERRNHPIVEDKTNIANGEVRSSTADETNRETSTEISAPHTVDQTIEGDSKINGDDDAELQKSQQLGDSLNQLAESRDQPAESRDLSTVSRDQLTESRDLSAVSRDQLTKSRDQLTESRDQFEDDDSADTLNSTDESDYEEPYWSNDDLRSISSLSGADGPGSISELDQLSVTTFGPTGYPVVTYKSFRYHVIPAIQVRRSDCDYYVAAPYDYDTKTDIASYWRKSYVMRERFLFRTMQAADRGNRLRVYEIISHLARVDSALRVLTRDVIVAAMLHDFDSHIDVTPRWQRNTVEEGVTSVFQTLWELLQTNTLPHFFMRQFNILEPISLLQLARLKARVRILFSNPAVLARAFKLGRIPEF